MLELAYNKLWAFITPDSYLPTHTIALPPVTFLQHLRLDPYIQRFVSAYAAHSNHRYFMDSRHIGYTIHLWTAFVQVTS